VSINIFITLCLYIHNGYRCVHVHTPYIFPQENGNRHNVKSFSLEDERNIRMYFETLDEKFDFSISEYTIENIENAGHTYDLKKSDFLQLKIDMEQYGLGSASCGEEVLEKYRLYCKDFEFSFKFSVFSGTMYKPKKVRFSANNLP